MPSTGIRCQDSRQRLRGRGTGSRPWSSTWSTSPGWRSIVYLNGGLVPLTLYSPHDNHFRALARPPTYVTKYFGCELGAQTQFDIKAERYIVNGCHDAGKMQDMLDGFIKKFVLCEKCENPETVLKVKKNMIGASCKACGHIYTMDMRHKLTTFIVKNPPEKDIDSQGSSQTEKKDRKKEKEEKKKGEKKNGGSDENNDDDDWGEDGDDGVWISDTSAEAIAKRAQEQLTSGISGLVIDSDMEKTEEERINIFFKFVQVKRGMINSAVAKEILAEAERY